MTLSQDMQSLIQTWQSLSGPQRNTFYKEKLWLVVKKKFLNEFTAEEGKRPDVLVSLVGFSPEPVILTVLALKPGRVHFICSKETEGQLDRITSECQLTVRQWDKTVLTGVDAMETYRELDRLIAKHADKKLALDITGGKKAMSAGAALVGFLKGIPCYYVDNREYNEAARTPQPGSEHLVLLSNPYEVFGSVEEAHADRLFNSGDYRAAELLYEGLCGRIPDPACRKCEIKKLVSAAYAAWHDFVFAKAYESLSEAVAKSEQFRIFCAQRQVWERQLALLSPLKNDEPNQYYELLRQKQYFESAAVSLATKAECCLEAGQAGVAAICAYRLLELIVQYRLLQHDVRANDVSQEVRSNYDSEFRNLHKRILGSEASVPTRLGLLHGMMLLCLMKDELISDEVDNILRELSKRLEVRNNLWIEHKNATISKEVAKSFLEYVYNRWLNRLMSDYEKRVKEVAPPDFGSLVRSM